MSLSGEYWILPDGSSIWADGDAGVDVANHVMVATEELFRRLGFDLSAEPITDKFQADELFDQALKDTRPWRPEWSFFGEYCASLYQQYDESWQKHATLEDYLRTRAPESQPGSFARDWAGLRDPSRHAVEHWGWYRVHEDHVETWTLSAQDCLRLAGGLWDAFDETVENACFMIEVRSRNKLLYSVPYAELAEGTAYRRLREAAGLLELL